MLFVHMIFVGFLLLFLFFLFHVPVNVLLCLFCPCFYFSVVFSFCCCWLYLSFYLFFGKCLLFVMLCVNVLLFLVNVCC